jgi:hypothetical protein
MRPVSSTIVPVIPSRILTAVISAKAWVTMDLKSNPATRIGIVPRKIFKQYAILSLSPLQIPLSNSEICLKKNTITAMRVPKWRKTARDRGSEIPNRCSRIARWPELDTGRNSVRPCTIPRIIVLIMIQSLQ